MANHLLLTALGLLPRSTQLGPNWIRLPPESEARCEVALTFDDGPNPNVTPRVLDLLDAAGVQGTFFCIGERAARHPDLCREIVERGHAVENHTQHHGHGFSLLGPRGLAREIRSAQETLTSITGQAPRFFRAPAGLRSPLLEPVLSRLDLRLATWTRRGFDTRTRDPKRVLRRLTRGLAAGDILLLHDGNAARTPDGEPVVIRVLPALLRDIAGSGLRPVALRSLVG
ncbi:MAG: polysaccharide deacetylase family protein [Chromatiaceae bacterium]